MNVVMEVQGIEDLLQSLHGYSANVAKLLIDVIQASQASVVQYAKQNHTFRNRTYNLETKIQVGRLIVDRDEITGEVVADAPYASFVEYGTSRAKAYPFMRPAIKQFQPSYLRAIKNVLFLAKKGVF